jgi:hypothetical protein
MHKIINMNSFFNKEPKQGCKRAVDEFLKDKPDIKIINIDYTGVFFIKP